MALVMRAAVTGRGGRLQSIETIEIRRLGPLRNPDDPSDETHRYRVRVYAADDFATVRQEVEVEHRYGDGARRLMWLALSALPAI